MTSKNNHESRRQFLKVSGLAAAGTVLAAESPPTRPAAIKSRSA